MKLAKNVAQTVMFLKANVVVKVYVSVCICMYVWNGMCVWCICCDCCCCCCRFVAVVPKNMINDILHLFSMMIIYTPFASHARISFPFAPCPLSCYNNLAKKAVKLPTATIFIFIYFYFFSFSFCFLFSAVFLFAIFACQKKN